MNSVDVLCVGDAPFDLYMGVSQHPLPDDKVFASYLIGCGGGPAANAAVTVARLGGRAAFAGYLGDDVWGEKHFQELAREGVLTDYVVRGSHPTSLSVILVKPDGQRTVVNYDGSTPYIPADTVDLSNLVPKVILFDGHEPLASGALVQAAQAKGIRTILDAGSVHDGTLRLVNRVDYVVCAEVFARDFTGESDAQQAAIRLNAQAPNVVVTLGEKGVVWSNAAGTGYVPAFPVTVVDSTGAGDAFHGAFAACLAQRQAWEDTLHYASAVAALCCTKVGARVGIPTRAEVEEFLTTRRVI